MPEGGGHDEIVRVHEQRGSNFSQSVLIGCMCFYPFLEVLTLVPNAALDGLFIFMGYSSFFGNQLAERFGLIFTEPRFRESKLPFFDTVSFDIQKQFTWIQAIIVVIIFGVTLTPAAMVFPVLIGILVPLRAFLLPKYMSSSDLEALDPSGKEEPSEELHANDDPILSYPHEGDINNCDSEGVPRERSTSSDEGRRSRSKKDLMQQDEEIIEPDC